MKILILYSGHLGTTQKAAYELSVMLGKKIEVLSTKPKKKIDFNTYDAVIFGSNVRMFHLNKRFRKYAKKWVATTTQKKAYAFIVGANTEKSAAYVDHARTILGEQSFIVFAGGELNTSNASGFAKGVIESVRESILKKGEPLPSLNIEALQKLADVIKTDLNLNEAE